ncbi:MAG: transporter [Thermodesulfovibrionia bacterium]|nr:transporter [Thermodesulfovibrionia bacterium]
MIKKVFTMIVIVLWYGAAFAAHPLITDDTGSQGKGKLLIEMNSEFTHNKETEEDVIIKETGGEVAAILSYGITDNADIVLGLPYQWSKTKEDGETTSDEDGVSDMSLEIKWRFFEKEGLSLALKPGLTLPTGDEEKGLGNGRASYGLNFITTKEVKPWAFHLNVAYTHNEYKLEADKDANRKDIWHVSLATEVEVVKNLRLVANAGMERNANKELHTHPAFILGGFIYSVSERLDVDFGVKAGINKSETDYTILAGLARRF